MNRNEFVEGLKDGIPIALGYLSVSFAFGITAVQGGLSPVQAMLISMTNLTSAGQLAGLNLMTQSLTAVNFALLLQMALTQLTINLRYALMSISLAQKLGKDMNTARRMIFAFGNTDEIFAVASGKAGELHHSYTYGLMLGPWIGWSGGTILGALAGSVVPDFVQTALGIAIYGMFVAVVLPVARRLKPVRVVAIVAALMSIACKYIPFLSGIPAGYAIILCAVGASCLGAALYPIQEDEGGKEAAE